MDVYYVYGWYILKKKYLWFTKQQIKHHDGGGGGGSTPSNWLLSKVDPFQMVGDASHDSKKIRTSYAMK